MRHQRVEVVWRDAFSDSAQSEARDWKPDYLVTTMGYLVAEDKTWLHVAQEVLPHEDGFRSVTHIPKRIVELVRKLRP